MSSGSYVPPPVKAVPIPNAIRYTASTLSVFMKLSALALS